MDRRCRSPKESPQVKKANKKNSIRITAIIVPRSAGRGGGDAPSGMALLPIMTRVMAGMQTRKSQKGCQALLR